MSIDRARKSWAQWQVLQDLVEQLVQLEEEALIRLEPPPMPKQDIIFWTSADPHSSQTTSLSLPGETRRSNLFPHFLQPYSKIGMDVYFTGFLSFRLIMDAAGAVTQRLGGPPPARSR